MILNRVANRATSIDLNTNYIAKVIIGKIKTIDMIKFRVEDLKK